MHGAKQRLHTEAVSVQRATGYNPREQQPDSSIKSNRCSFGGVILRAAAQCARDPQVFRPGASQLTPGTPRTHFFAGLRLQQDSPSISVFLGILVPGRCSSGRGGGERGATRTHVEHLAGSCI